MDSEESNFILVSADQGSIAIVIKVEIIPLRRELKSKAKKAVLFNQRTFKELQEKGYTVVGYGISFYQKNCWIEKRYN